MGFYSAGAVFTFDFKGIRLINSEARKATPGNGTEYKNAFVIPSEYIVIISGM